MLDIDRLHADFPNVDVYNDNDAVIIGSLADRMKITIEKPTGDMETKYGRAAWLYDTLDEAKANISPRDYTLVPRKKLYTWVSVRLSGTVSARSLDEAFATVDVPRGYPVTIAGETRWPGNEALFTGTLPPIYAPPDTPDDVIGARVLANYPSLNDVLYRRIDWAHNKTYTRGQTFNWSTTTASGTVTARSQDEAFTLTPVPRGRSVTIDGQTRFVGDVIEYSAGKDSLYFPPGTPHETIGAAFANQWDRAPGGTVRYRRVDGRSYKYTVPRKRVEQIVDGWQVYSTAETLAEFAEEARVFIEFFYGDNRDYSIVFNGVKHKVTR